MGFKRVGLGGVFLLLMATLFLLSLCKYGASSSDGGPARRAAMAGASSLSLSSSVRAARLGRSLSVCGGSGGVSALGLFSTLVPVGNNLVCSGVGGSSPGRVRCCECCFSGGGDMGLNSVGG